MSSFHNNESNSPTILEVTFAKYENRIMMCYNDAGLLLYGPNEHDDIKMYDIILFVETATKNPYSLFRFDEQFEAEKKFCYLLVKFMPFLEVAVTKKMTSTKELQGILDILNNNPSWTPAHLAAYFNYHNSFDHESIMTYLNTPDDTGKPPLQVAVIQEHLKSVQSLLRKKVSLHHIDFEQNSVLHHAATTTKDILTALLVDVPPHVINCYNSQGYTPLHIACLSEKYDCVSALLLAGAEVNIQVNRRICQNNNYSSMVGIYIQNHPNFLNKRDIKHCGTPLHWATSPEEINELIAHKCDINAVNIENRTALHVMVKKQKFDCILALLSRGADTNATDGEFNTALHLAAQSPENLHILHSLIIFGADLNALNNNGESPRHIVARSSNLRALYCLHAVGANRCTEGTPGCNDGCYAYGKEDGEAPTFFTETATLDNVNQMLDVAGMETLTNKYANEMPKKGRLLSLDGGGIRGLILIQMLLELETVIGKPINHCFDWITGTSTGGILALGLASGKTAKECLGLYFSSKDRMFTGLRPYPSEPLEAVLEEMLGSDTYLRDILYPKVIIPCARANRHPIELYLYRNYESANEILSKSSLVEDTHLWEVARATSAAPTYFRPFKNFIDGGLIANNPTVDALTEIQQYNSALRASGRESEQCPVNIVVSLGTGLVPAKDTVQVPDNLPDVLKLLAEVPDILSIIIDQATAASGRVVERARAWCASLGIPYFRFNPQMSEDVGLNEKCAVKLCRTLWETKTYMYANTPKIKEVAHFLNRD